MVERERERERERAGALYEKSWRSLPSFLKITRINSEEADATMI